MNPHPHAEVLRAIADGVPLSEFEVKSTKDKDGYWNELQFASIIKNPAGWEIRRKPQHIMVNGFKVPKPLDVEPMDGEKVFAAWISASMGDEEDCFDSSYSPSGYCRRAIKYGIAHATKEAAIAHAKAMLGIDPEYFK